MWIQSPRSPREGEATQSSVLTWRIPWTEETGRLQSMRSQRVRHDWAHTHTKPYMTTFQSFSHFCFCSESHCPPCHSSNMSSPHLSKFPLTLIRSPPIMFPVNTLTFPLQPLHLGLSKSLAHENMEAISNSTFFIFSE